MELRCASRSLNNPEMSKFELGISYLLRLIAVSSTENDQRVVLPSFAPSKQAQV
jgi:hypothetical protein